MTSQKVAAVIMVKKYYRSVKQLLTVSRRGRDIVLRRQTPNSKVEFVFKLVLRGSVKKLKSSRYPSDCWNMSGQASVQKQPETKVECPTNFTAAFRESFAHHAPSVTLIL